ncbi:MAG TPA: dienelactone hydrolase family protein [Bryobacteraceae bacterium]|nr:dienelactone hydrolase family protein [Bryobacteraceae bacterium]
MRPVVADISGPADRLSTGFAAAVVPISAGTITTDTEGLDAGEISVPTADGHIPGYRAMPRSGRSFPVVMVVHEIFGVHEHIKDICRRFAKLGYMAVAPELYARQGDVAKLSNIQDIVSQVVSKVPDAQVMSDLDSAVKWASNSGKGDAGRLGVTGFCWGGRIVWLYAAHNPNLKAGVAWYGRLVGQASQLQPQHPIDVAGSLKAPVLGLYGAKDQGIPQDTIARVRAALKAAGDPSEIIVYPEAGHGFNADYRPGYSQEAAEDGWKRLRQWFERFGVA